MTDDFTDTMAHRIADFSVTEGNADTVVRLKRLLIENDEATENLVKAIELERLLMFCRSNWKTAEWTHWPRSVISAGKMIKPILTYEEVKFFFERSKGGNANDITYRMALIDTFVIRLDDFDGEDSRLEIWYNAFKQNKVP